ncbi:MAG: 2-amino-4-hydroxy-6-hydroxymethyldihydropteridine diphosphokinase [Myxococcales bacterium]|nr:2-amino-4-hydroxy-6-hydroxymethyldihydropteridine diphosphokinase [Myxococcales bacterium]
MSDLIYIGLGSNLGDREKLLQEAVLALCRIDAVAVVGRSSLYESAPLGPPQPRYLNAVVSIECALEPERLLTILKEIERDLGRTEGDRWGPRPIDLDILLWGERVVADAKLQIPHLDLHNRRFALEPLCELDPSAVHPLLGATMRELWSRLSHQDVVKLDSAQWQD